MWWDIAGLRRLCWSSQSFRYGIVIPSIPNVILTQQKSSWNECNKRQHYQVAVVHIGRYFMTCCLAIWIMNMFISISDYINVPLRTSGPSPRYFTEHTAYDCQHIDIPAWGRQQLKGHAKGGMAAGYTKLAFRRSPPKSTEFIVTTTALKSPGWVTLEGAFLWWIRPLNNL